MVRRLSSLSAALACLLAASAGHAAETPLAPPVLPDDFTSGWYIRGDVSGLAFTTPHATYTTLNGGPLNPQPYQNIRFGQTFGGGLGLGFRAGPFRFDTTIDLRSPARFSGATNVINSWAGVPPAPGLVPSPAAIDSLAIASRTALLNAYLELGPFAGFSPYLGFGIGVAHLSASTFRTLPVQAAVDLGALAETRAVAGGSRFSFAYAAMAGIAIDITPQLKLDLGYRFVNMGRASLDAVPAAGEQTRIRIAPLTAHEFRVGLRWMFGDGK